MANKVKVVHGDDLLYRFFQNALKKEPELFAKVPRMMLEAMGIWFPRKTYRVFPVLLPWVVRDASCRGNKLKGIPDMWGAPNGTGYCRDDNSLVKALPRSFSVCSPALGNLNGARMGNEFVASHVWREVKGDALASRNPLLNSFIPNLVWLPSQVAKLTDREGEIVQRTLQSMAYAIYRDAPVDSLLVDVVEAAWSMIPEPEPIDIADSDINWFAVTDRFLTTRTSRLGEAIDVLETLAAGGPIPPSNLPSRYVAGLPQVTEMARVALLADLRRYLPGSIP